MNLGPYAESVLSQIQAAGRRERRRRRLRAVGGVGVAAAAVTTSVVLLAGPAAADVEVTVRDGIVHVRITDEATLDEMVDALTEKGIDAKVTDAPTGPSRVGKFVTVEVSGGEVVHTAGQPGPSFDEFDVREGWDGVLTITLGRKAVGDEPYDGFTDAFADDEILHCRHVLGATLGDAAERLRGLEVRVAILHDGVPGEHLDLATAVNAHPDLVVTKATRVSRDSVFLDVAPVQPFKDAQC